MCNGGDRYLGNSLLEMMREKVSKKISVGVDFIFNCKGISLCDIHKASNLGENPHFQKRGKKKGGFKKKILTRLLNV